MGVINNKKGKLMTGMISFVSLLALNHSTAMAGTTVCNGTVDTIAYHAPGYIMLKLSSMNVPVFICNTDSGWAPSGSLAGSTTPAACKALYASFLAAKTNGSYVSQMYMDGDDVTGSCDTFPNWAGVNIRYFSF